VSLISLGIADMPVTTLQADSGPTSDFWYYDIPSGSRLSASDAVKVAAVGACIRILSETPASLPLHVYRRTADEGREIARDQPLYYVLHNQANDYQTSFEWIEWTMRQILVYGAALSRLVTDSSDNVIAFDPIDWCDVQIRKDAQTGIRVFVCTRDGKQVNYLDSEVLFIPGPGCTPWKVESLIDQYNETIGLSYEAQRYVRQYFSKGAVGPVFATFPNRKGEEALKNWVKWFRDNFTGIRGASQVPVFDDGGRLEPLKIDHKQMELVELRRFGIEDICRVFGVPPHLVFELMRSTNNNIEHQGIEFGTYRMRPWLVRIEQRLNASCFGPRQANRFYCEFDMDGLLRGDSAAQAALLNAEIQNAVRTPNEARRKRNLNRYDDPAADQLFIQGATVPIDMVGQQQQQGAPQ